MTDTSSSPIISYYDIDVQIDDGIGVTPKSPSGQGSLSSDGTQLFIDLQLKLGLQDGTLSPQQLILNITYTGTGSPQLTI